MGIDQIDFGLETEHRDDEKLELKNHDSLDEPDMINGVLSKSFDMNSIKLDSEMNYTDSNRSSVFSYKKDKNENDNKDLEARNGKSQSKTNDSIHHFEHTHQAHNVSGNLNVRAAAIHIIGDIIQSVGVLLAAMIIYVFPGFNIIDPI